MTDSSENKNSNTPNKEEIKHEDKKSSALTHEQIQKIIEEQFPTSIRKWLRKKDLELSLILSSNLIPKCEEQLLLQGKIQTEKAKLPGLVDALQKAEEKVAEKEAVLRFWERDAVVILPAVSIKNFITIGPCSIKPWSFLNSLFDWILKMGLSVVPILSLFSIFTISDLNNLKDSLVFRISVFCGISLVWMTSATVSNWIITKDDSNTELQENSNNQSQKENVTVPLTKIKVSKPKIPKLVRNDKCLFVLIWFLEALIGYATVPPLIDLARRNQITIDPNTGIQLTPLSPLTGMEKFEILLGVSIFALINILFSIAKGRIYHVNTPKKKELGAAVANRDIHKMLLENCLKEIEKLEKLNQDLEQLLRPNDLIGKFHRRIDDLSVFASQGINYTDIPDTDIPDEEEPENSKKK